MKKRFLILALAISLVLQSFLAISCNTERPNETEATEKATEDPNEKVTDEETEEYLFAALGVADKAAYKEA